MQQTTHECMLAYLSGLEPYLDRALRESPQRFRACAGRSAVEVAATLWYFYFQGVESDLAYLAEQQDEDDLVINRHFRWLLLQCIQTWIVVHHANSRSFFIHESLRAFRTRRVA